MASRSPSTLHAPGPAAAKYRKVKQYSTATSRPVSLNRAVSRLPTETLLLWGDADRLIGRDVIDALMARRPDWDLHVFPTVGHCAQIEVPQQYLDVVQDWLHRPAGTGSGLQARASS
jgi:pimeloyl-ACP methyl ester carboxylesterase